MFHLTSVRAVEENPCCQMLLCGRNLWKTLSQTGESFRPGALPPDPRPTFTKAASGRHWRVQSSRWRSQGKRKSGFHAARGPSDFHLAPRSNHPLFPKHPSLAPKQQREGSIFFFKYWGTGVSPPCPCRAMAIPVTQSGRGKDCLSPKNEVRNGDGLGLVITY